ncbi:NHLP family bacteriocin export ABC transporter peptidase/permease/ATPase subunit [Paenibacillus cymbidii]|uniref:NHLP family bacteriocin export ABC transporter peptidase/permease/ATPase subunit n=1 Tax=Paenibacillus cymbidii TaxID=1639034 RepID=UPI001080DD8A|nr:NHLP family bacteriocin export ABC transporter peptidase/permease/ATPase subunit [Paenibacillus cymbidii]
MSAFAGKQPTEKPIRSARVRTPTVLQMEEVECGAAALAIVLAYHGRQVPLERLRVDCGVTRDGSNALNIVKAARSYALTTKAFRKEPAELRGMALPMIIHWQFNHFVVLEGFGGKNKVYINDPSAGPRTVTAEEFDASFTGIAITFEPSDQFVRRKERWQMLRSLQSRLAGTGDTLTYVVLTGLLLVVPGLVIPAFSRIFVDDVLLAGLNNWIVPLLAGMGLTALMRGLLTLLRQHYLIRLETGLSMNMSGRFFWHVLRLPIAFFQQRHAGEIASRIAINSRLAHLLGGELAIALLDLLMIVFYFVLLVQYSWLLTLLGIVIALANFVFLRFVSRVQTDRNQRLMLDDGKMDGVSMSGLGLIETLKASGAEADFFRRWAGWQSKLLHSQQKLGETGQYVTTVPGLLFALNEMAILTAGGLYVMNGTFTIGMLVAFQSLMASFLGPVGRMLQLGTSWQEIAGSLSRLDDVYRYPAAASAGAGAAADVAGRSKLQGSVQLTGVSFGYNPLDEPLIADFGLALKPGAHVALVGGTGSGKSTIARLITGLQQPQAGEVRFDGSLRGEIPPAVLAGSLASVDQTIHLFQGTIRDNITLWDDTVPESDLVRACKDAQIHDAIAARPGGYDHQVTEGGANFSGGQRQRLEIARALCANPSILVLDEATSALDPLTEKAVMDAIRRRGCTCITIAHRLSTIRDADEIIVLERGNVVERGPHEQLIGQGGLYAALVAG